MRWTRNCEIWLPEFVRDRIRAARRKPAKRVWLAITDHYEPLWNGANEETAKERVALWQREWPAVASGFRDAAGRMPVYSFFYAEEEYRPHLLEPLAEMTRDGIGDVEVHLHHDGEGEQNFVDRIGAFTETLRARHGLLRQHDGRTVFGFIHGNWALDNSRPDGRRCGLNNELTLLKKLGCYADFTLPSAPEPTQTRTVNAIYWAVDDPERPKSHDTGTPVERFPDEPEGALLMVPGPLGIRCGLLGTGDRLFPRFEIGELASYDVPTRRRARLWISLAPRIGDDVFIKLYTHGTQERHSEMLFGGGLRSLFQEMTSVTRENGQELYFASAWHIRQAVDALRAGHDPVAILDHHGSDRSLSKV